MSAGATGAALAPHTRATVFVLASPREQAPFDLTGQWVSVVEDPRYLNQPFITSSHFRREPDASKWMPQPCEPTD